MGCNLVMSLLIFDKRTCVTIFTFCTVRFFFFQFLPATSKIWMLILSSQTLTTVEVICLQGFDIVAVSLWGHVPRSRHLVLRCDFCS